MPLITINAGKKEHVIKHESKATVWEIIQPTALIEMGECGGQGICGKCRVMVSGQVSAVSAAERDFLTGEELEQGWRLACYTEVLGDCTVTIAEYLDGLNDASQMSMRAPEFLALDVGSTSVVLAEVNDKGRVISQIAFDNPQRIYGSDVVSRLSFALQGPENRLLLRKLLINGINRHLELIDTSRVKTVVVVGNPVMIHLLRGADVAGLASYPYRSVITESEELTARETGLSLESDPVVYFPPPAGLYVGSDALCGAVSLLPADNYILIDLGTNAEVIARSQDKWLAASAAAGPAWEGACIYQGMRALPGAITGFSYDHRGWQVKTIGNQAPAGICGSGLIAVIAGLRKLGIINNDGLISSADIPGIKVRSGHQGQEVVLYEGDNGTVVLTQEDIRQFQLAKSAVRVAINTLMAQLPDVSWEQFFLAGAFGSSMDADAVGSLGILPELPGVSVVFAGNTALSGAARAACDYKFREQIEEIASRIEILELANQPDFQSAFIRHLSLESGSKSG